MKVEIKDLSEVAFYQEGPGVRTSQFCENGVKLINVTNISSGKLDLSKTKTHISKEEAFGKYKHFLLEANDIVMASSGATWGKTTIVNKKDLPLCMNTSVIRFRPLNEKILTKEYLKIVLDSIDFKKQIKKLITGAAQPNFGPTHLGKVKVAIPSLSDQIQIAKILSKAEALMEQRKQSITLLDEFLKSSFFEMFGDPITNKMKWELKKLGLITSMKSGEFVSASDIISEFRKELFPCYGGNGLRGYTKSFTHDGDFLLIGRQGALCGNVKVAKGKFHATEHAVVCSQIMNYETSWLYYLLEIINLNKYATGVAQPGLAVGKLEQIEIIFPPIKLQTQFTNIVCKIETLKEQYKTSLVELENLYGSLSQRAFKGNWSFQNL